MSMYEWLLFLHLLAAFLLVAGLVAYGVMVFGSPSEASCRARSLPPATALWNAGGLGVIVFGVWLALEVEGYELWDGWIIAAIVLWFVGSGAGGRLARRACARASRTGPSTARGRWSMVMALATLLLLLDMIFKPGVT